MGNMVRAGEIDFVSGGRAITFRVPVKSTLKALHFRLTGNLVVTVAATLREDGVLRLVKRMEISVGGVKIKSIGDGSAYASAAVHCYYYNQLLYGALPNLSQPAVGVATNAFSADFAVPFEMPPALASMYPSQVVGVGDKAMQISARKITELSPTGKDIEIDVDWGAVADVISAGTATLSSVKLEVVAEVEPELDIIQMPLLLQETTKQATLNAGANTREETDLDRFGIVPFIMVMAWDNSVRADNVFNRYQYVLNGDNYKIDMSWGLSKNDAKRAAGLQATTLPTGVNLGLFDREETGDGAIILDAGDVKRFSFFLDHAALTATFKVTLHQFQISKQG